MSKKHKKKARATTVKPHTVKEANRRKRLRDDLKSKRISTKAMQSSKTDISNSGGGTNDPPMERASKSENTRHTNSNAKEVDET
jgi:hypothetical protein